MTPEERRALGLRAAYTRPTSETSPKMARLEASIIGHRFGVEGCLIGLRREGQLGGKAAFRFFCTSCGRTVRFRSQQMGYRVACGLRGCWRVEETRARLGKYLRRKSPRPQ